MLVAVFFVDWVLNLQLIYRSHSIVSWPPDEQQLKRDYALLEAAKNIGFLLPVLAALAYARGFGRWATRQRIIYAGLSLIPLVWSLYFFFGGVWLRVCCTA